MYSTFVATLLYYIQSFCHFALIILRHLLAK